MRKNSRRTTRRRRHTENTPRAKVERMIGRKLLTGQIPVVRPGDIPTCPVTSTHVKAFDDCCKDYVAGKMSETETLTKVTDILRGIKKPQPSEMPRPSEAGTGEQHT